MLLPLKRISNNTVALGDVRVRFDGTDALISNAAGVIKILGGDFQVVGSALANLLYCDESADNLGVGTASPPRS